MSDAQSDDVKKRIVDFALKDYELKIAYLTAHFQRVWTRFNYFVVIEAALIGGKTIFGAEAISIAGLLFGFGLSVVWYVMGAQDKFLIEVYRKHIRDAARRVEATAWDGPLPYHPVGETEAMSKHVPMDISTWRISAISTTRLAALIPLAVSLVWLPLLVWRLIKM